MAENNTPTNEQLSEFNHHIKDGIRQWSDICLNMDVHNVTAYFDYSQEDLANALLIFQHVFQNIAIKNRLIPSEEVAELVGNDMHDFIEKFTGVDMRKIYE